MRWFKPGQDFDFMGKRPYFVGASLVFMLMSAVLLFVPGIRYGTDFKGGTEVEIAFQKPVEAGALRRAVQRVGFSSPDVVAVTGADVPHVFLIRVQEVTALSEEQKKAIQSALCLVDDRGKPPREGCAEEQRVEEVKFSPGGDKVSARYSKDPCGPAQGNEACPPRADIAGQLGNIAGIKLRRGAGNPVVQNPRDHKVEFFLESRADQIVNGLRQELGEDTVPADPRRAEWIGPKAGKQLRDAALISIAISLLAIMVYVAFRFDMRFAPGGVIALFHDVLIAVGANVLTGREVSLSTVAALLTIVGYSINDTVIVYDRIRENLGKQRKMNFLQVINRSITEMFDRTIRTSSTVVVCLIPFMFLGTGAIKDFAFTMQVGVIFGTYSSIYIASPITEWIDRAFFGAKLRKRRRARRRRTATEQPEGAV
ncbi:MAG: protein translocase subunit SecF [Deltaproteobacteria bacterium]|nr:protein translocase subunit SecF [Deltaproteobacteria bacterium]